MRNKVHKFCVVLALGLLPAAAGCAAGFAPPIGGLENPACPNCPTSDWDRSEEIPNVIRFYMLKTGKPYPDPARRPLNAKRLLQLRGNVEKLLAESGDYDPNQIFEDYARRIRTMCADGRTLVILIHGFNTTLPEICRAYECARERTERFYPNRKFAFLEIFWEGLYGDVFAIWPQAQCNSKWAGLGLRNLLNRLPSSLPIRVLTHSRGAVVICSALWNTELRNTAEADVRYRELQKMLPPPFFPGMRIGLIAPAMLAWDFETYGERCGGEFYFHDRIILGINEDDHALNAGGLSGIAGTTLGCSLEIYHAYVAPILNRGRAHGFAVDFSGSVEHSFFDYLYRKPFKNEFLPRLLAEAPDEVVAAPPR